MTQPIAILPCLYKVFCKLFNFCRKESFVVMHWEKLLILISKINTAHLTKEASSLIGEIGY
jgi:hypothetical protein